ncbi:MAG TPA: metallophosphoesterase family protein [Gaiellaceae bacterium]|nr:metallophosphoesterase family protein [Gaiellaceae bacterium]
MEVRPFRARAGTRRRRFLSRVAVISDTHLPRGTRTLPEACVKLLRGADLILHAGDFVSVAFLQELRALGPPVEGVHGNMDEPALKALLPKQHVVEVDSLRIGMVHDAGPRARREARLAARFPECGAVVYGHSHVPQVERFQHLWVLNPGSPTDKRRQPVATMLVLRIRGSRITPELVNV